MIIEKTIKEFSAGDMVQGFFLVKNAEVKSGSNNVKYLCLLLTDKSGEINARLWNSTEEQEQQLIEGTLAKVRGEVNEWQGQLQLKIERIRPVQLEEVGNIEDYVQSAPFSSEEMYCEITQYLSKISDENIRGIVEYILENNSERLMYYPAAKKNHHSIRAGLLYHITTMLKAAERLGEIYTYVNMDLLYGGVILHDIGKLYEMDSNALGIVADYTVEGNLLGHIIQGIKLVELAAVETGADTKTAMLLQHMILSHHYEPECGSPKQPMLPEAELLHYLDIIDSRMFDMNKAVESTKSGKFSDKIWSLENRRVYRAE